MAKSIFGLALNNNNDAAFRAWGSSLSTQIGALLTRVPQSNDVNWTTVTRPLSSSTFTASEVFRFNDSLQSTKPLFLRIEYGSGISAISVGLRLTVGKSVDGSGNIGGVLLPAQIVTGLQGEDTITRNCYISGGSSWFALSLAPSVSFLGGVVLIERSTNTPDALLVGWQTAASINHEYRFIDYANTTSESVSGGIVAVPLSLASDRSVANGTTAPIFPAACISPSGVYWRPRVILGTARQNAGLGEVINGLLDGNTYLSLGAGSQRCDQRNSTFSATLIRWD